MAKRLLPTLNRMLVQKIAPPSKITTKFLLPHKLYTLDINQMPPFMASPRFGMSSSSTQKQPKNEDNLQESERDKTNGSMDMKTEKHSNEPISSSLEDETKKTSYELKTPPNNGRRKIPQKKEPEAFSDSNLEGDLSRDDFIKLVAEKEMIIKTNKQEIERLHDKVLRGYAEMENVLTRAKRDAENAKKFAIQSFVEGLLDVADNLERASSSVRESFSKADESKDKSEIVPLLKRLLEGVEMTDKQLIEVLKKFGVSKFYPLNEEFDPRRHDAIFQVPDESKPAGIVAAVQKPGYLLYDRVIRPAEVGVVVAKEKEMSDVVESTSTSTTTASL